MRLCSALLLLNRKTDCDPNNTPAGSICFEYPAGREAELEAAAIREGLTWKWGIGGGGFLKIYRVAADNTFVLVGSVVLAAAYQKMILQGRYIYACKVSGGSANLVTIDVGRPSAPVAVSTLNVGIPDCLNLHAQGRFVFVVGVSGTVAVDVSVPGSPIVRGTI